MFSLTKYITKESLDFNEIKELLAVYYKDGGFKVTEKKLNHDAESALFIISSILFSVLVYKRDESKRAKYKEYIHLYANSLKKIIGADYKLILTFLVEADLIKVRYGNNGTETYISGYKSKSYAINKLKIHGETIFGYYQYINKSLERYKKGIPKKTDVYEHLHSFVKKLKISDFSVKEEHCPLMKMFLTQDKESYMHVDKSGRNYNKMTNMFSYARHFMTYNGQPLVNIDCSNSQPFLLYFLYKRTNDDTEDSLKYLDVVKRGQLYEELKVDYEKIKGKIFTRKEVKETVYCYILFNHKKYKHPIRDVFKNKFPSIDAVINENQRYKDDLSFQLRKIESNIWIHSIAQRIMEDHPEIPIFILHDSILTTRQNTEKVHGYVQEAFIQILGFIPDLKVTFYGRDTEDFVKDTAEYYKNVNIIEKRNILKIRFREFRPSQKPQNITRKIEKHHICVNSPP